MPPPLQSLPSPHLPTALGSDPQSCVYLGLGPSFVISGVYHAFNLRYKLWEHKDDLIDVFRTLCYTCTAGDIQSHL